MSLDKNKAVYKEIRKVITLLTKHVVSSGMINDRVGALSVDKQKQIKLSKSIDARSPLWLSISGKGGPDYECEYRNVSLADHSISVCTGAVVFAGYYLADHDCDIDDNFSRQLFTVGLVGLLHDINKLFDKNIALSNKEILEYLDELYIRWDLKRILDEYGIALTSNELFQLINYTEAGTSLAGTESGLVDSKLRQRCRVFVRMADQLDSAFYRVGADGGVDGVLNKLSTWAEADQNFISSMDSWHHVRLADAAHPYLLDRLQYHISQQCIKLAGVAPLLSIHADGVLDLLVPEDAKDQIISASFKSFGCSLSAPFSVVFSTTKQPDIMGGVPGWGELLDYINNDTHSAILSSLLTIGRPDLDFISALLIDNCYGLSFSDKSIKGTSATVSPICSSGDESEDLVEFYKITSIISLILNHGSQVKSIKVISQNDRKEKILNLLSLHNFEIEDQLLSSALSQTVWFAMNVASFAMKNDDFYSELMDENGLLSLIYCGSGSGTSDKEDHGFTPIQDGLKGDLDNERILNVIERLSCLLDKKSYLPQIDSQIKTQCCLVTGEPVDTKCRIEAKDDLYAIKMSQFSERNGRQSVLGDAKGFTTLSPTSYMEYKLRTRIHENSKADMPVLISSPNAVGLFSEIRFSDEKMANKSDFFGLYDICREDKSKLVLNGPEIFSRRLFMARQESFPAKLYDQVEWLDRLIKSVRRTGRPFHVFRGLPTSRPEILYIDCLSPSLKRLIGNKSGFRIEELPTLHDQLILVLSVLDTRGSMSLLYGLLDHKMEYRSLCGIKCLLDDYVADKTSQNKMQGISRFAQVSVDMGNRLNKFKVEGKMTTQDNAIITLAHLASKVQKGFNSRNSRGEQLLILTTIMESVRTHVRNRMPMDQSLKNAIAGNIEKKLSGTSYICSSEYRNKQPLLNACIDIADHFVDAIWLPIFNGRMPNHNFKSQVAEIYRVEMLSIYQNRRNEKQDASLTV